MNPTTPDPTAGHSPLPAKLTDIVADSFWFGPPDRLPQPLLDEQKHKAMEAECLRRYNAHPALVDALREIAHMLEYPSMAHEARKVARKTLAALAAEEK